MYFNAEINGANHIWRQRFPDGAPQQITMGPSEEQGLAVAPDGKSLISSVGVRKSFGVDARRYAGSIPFRRKVRPDLPSFPPTASVCTICCERTLPTQDELWSTERDSGDVPFRAAWRSDDRL